MRISHSDLELLQRVDRRWGAGDFQADIARDEGFADASGIHRRLNRLGFRFGRRAVVATLGGAPLSDLLARGEIVSADQPAEVAA